MKKQENITGFITFIFRSLSKLKFPFSKRQTHNKIIVKKVNIKLTISIHFIFPFDIKKHRNTTTKLKRQLSTPKKVLISAFNAESIHIKQIVNAKKLKYSFILLLPKSALFTPLSPTFLYKKKADKKRKHNTPKDKKALKKKFPFPKKLKISLPLKKPAPTTPPINKNDNFNTLKKLFTRIDYATRVNNLTFLFNLLFFAFYFFVNFIV